MDFGLKGESVILKRVFRKFVKINRILILPVVLFLAACAADEPETGSPGEVLRRYVEASQKQDAAAMKSLLSKASLAMLESSARNQKETVDAVLRKEAALQIEKMPATRGEKIAGETATLEIRNETAPGFYTMPFVREDGAWKIARDKYVEQLRRTGDESSPSGPPAPAAETNAGGNQAPANK